MMVIKKFELVFVVWLLALYGHIASSQNIPSNLSDNPIPLDSTVRHGVLDNGLTYYLKSTELAKNEVYMKLAVKAGSFFETPSQKGYAHLLEHVALFNKNKTDLYANIKDAGLIHRAQTGQIVTKYQLIVPNADKQKLELGLSTLKSWAGEIVFDSLQVYLQRGAVLGENRTKNTYDDWLINKLGQIQMQNVEFPIHSIEKELANLKKLKMDQLKSFYKNWYRPDMQAIIIVGDINLDSLQHLVEEKFAGLKKRAGCKNYEPILKRFRIKLEGGNQYEHIKDSIDKEGRLIMLSKEKNYDYIKISEKDYYHMFLQKIVNHIAQRRSQQIQKQYSPPFVNFTTDHTVSTYFVNQVLVSALQVSLNGKTREKIDAALIAYKSLFSNFTDQEVEDARSAIQLDFNRQFNSNFDLAESYLENFIRKSAAPSLAWQRKLNDLLLNISKNEVQDFANKSSNLFKNKDFIFINIDDKNAPGRKKLIEMAKKISSQPISYNPPAITMAISDTILNHNNKDKANTITSTNLIGVTRVNLSNNINLWLKPTKPRSDQFESQVEILGFQPVDASGSNEDVISEILVHSYASYAGAGGFNKFQVAQYLEDYNLALQFRTEDDDFLVEGKFQKENVDEFFKLFFLKLKEPDKDMAAFSSWKKHEKSFKAVRASSNFFRREIEKIWYPDYPFIDETTLDTISRDLVLSKYSEHFSDFKNYNFIITGDFNSETLLKQISKHFERLPVSESEHFTIPLSKKFKLRKINDTIRLQNLDQVLAEIYYPVKVPVNSKSEIILELAKLALDEKIFRRLRIGSYSPVANGYWINKKDGLYTFLINFDSELGYEKNMLEFAQDEFLKLRETGVGQDWLDAMIELRINRYHQIINSFGYFNFWPDYLRKAIKNEENPEDWVLQYPSLLKNFIPLEEVNEAIRKYLSMENQQTFFVFPEQKVY